MKNTEEATNLRALRAAITQPQIKVVSFDVFDTLLVRPVHAPTDLFYLVEQRIHAAPDLPDLPFLDLRCWAEKQARDRMRVVHPFYEDITLDEIYDEIARYTGLNESICTQIKNIEIEVELKYLVARKSVKQIYDFALVQGKQVIVASDVYLPGSVLLEALQRNGYDQIQRYFVSSHLRLSKGRDSLYPAILQDMSVQAHEVIHVGDNLRADVTNARKAGIKAFHVPKVSALMNTARVDHSLWQDRLNVAEPGYRILHGMIQNDLFDTLPRGGYDPRSHVNGDPYYLGYYALGPFVLSMAQWMLRAASTRQDDVVAFVARDGYVPKMAYDLLAPLYPNAPPSIYFRMSRSVCYPFDITDTPNLMFSTKYLHFERSLSVRNLIESRLFFNIEADFEAWLKAEGVDLESTCKDFARLMATLGRYPGGIMQGLDHHRNLASRYYRDIFAPYQCVSLFDCGYSARAQRVLNKMLPEKKLFGFYVGSFENIQPVDQAGLSYANFWAPPFNRGLTEEPFVTALLELFLSEFETGSVVGFEETADGIEPIIEAQAVDVHTRRLLTAIHTGCMDFVRKAVTHFGSDLPYLYTTPTTASIMLKEIMLNPYAKDAEMFSKIMFTNGITGEVRQIIGKDEVRSKWKQGWRAINRGRQSVAGGEVQTPTRHGQRSPVELHGDKIVHNNRMLPARITPMRVLPAVDFLNGVAQFAAQTPPPDLRQSCREIVRHESKWLAAAIMLRDCGGLWRSKLHWRDKVIAQGYLIFKNSGRA